MPIQPSGPATSQKLSLSSPAAISRIFSSLRANLSASDWLHPANPYRSNCPEQITVDLASGAGVNVGYLSEYIAASVPLHCSDGWTFLARALTSYANGNPHQAAHFAYYAELRAAMSILASQGIGVFNQKHFVVDGAGGLVGPLNGSTHEITWQSLDYWAGTANSGAALLELFIVAGVPIREWFDAVPGLAVANSLGSNWLRQWGLDLSTAGTDRDMRNLASYRPTEFTAWDTDARGCSEFLRSMWMLFEPGPHRFDVLDKYLLRLLVKKTVLNVDPADPVATANAWQALSDMLNGLAIGDSEREVYREFLISAEPTPNFLQMAETAGSAGDHLFHERIIARAALLLRVASGFTAQLIDQATFTMHDVRFWTDPWGDRRAFWAPNEAPDDFADLWSDVDVAIGEEVDWIEAASSEPISMNAWRLGREETVRSLTECDRVSLWALQR